MSDPTRKLPRENAAIAREWASIRLAPWVVASRLASCAMPACPHTLTCGLHRSITMKEALRVWQSFYCDGVFGRCERYKLAIAGEPVPDKLLPNGRLIDPVEGELLRARSGR